MKTKQAYFLETIFSQTVNVNLPSYLELILISRPDVRDMINNSKFFKNENKIVSYINWWHLYGKNEYNTLEWHWENDYLPLMLAPSKEIPQDVSMSITNTMIAILESRDDLQVAFDLNTLNGRNGFINWVEVFAEKENSLYTYINKLSLNNLNSSDNKINAEFISSAKLGAFQPNGINITGFARGELGIGEDVRMAALASLKTDIPFSIYNISINLGTRASSLEFDQYIQEAPFYHANLICLPCLDTCQLLLKAGIGFFNNRYNIGAWQWELPRWPKQQQIFFNMLDEVWAFSRYAEKMYQESSPVPVTYMPMAVEYPLTSNLSRKDFNLPENKFLFLIMFDGNSWLTRKNPLGSVRAFINAFPKLNQAVGLVIKGMNIKEEHPDWIEIKKIVSNDSRIIIKVGHMSRPEVMGLINNCDAFVSLHRAEGFGRILAESMLLNKPVIATNFSGNCDFTNEETAFMVNGSLVSLKEGDYHFWENQYWCDPDIEEAAKQMQVCFENETLREKIAVAGQKYIQTHHSAAAIGECYKKRLKEIGVLS